jgi:catechol 1,2-dioxygenase
MDRRFFLRNTALLAVAMSTVGRAVKGAHGSFEGDCETTNDILGPFYRENAPERSDMTFDGLEGCIIHVKGTVFGPDCKTPLKGAQIEIWHCNTEGEYDNDSDDFRHRALQKTDANGKYSFKTIMPGKYLNGELYRPAHIHFRVTESKSNELISQLYFKDDPHIALDPWASDPSAKLRTLAVFPEDTNGNLAVTFNIYLSTKK